MADYFALLATRLVGSPDAVRPVLPARFETPPAVSPAASKGEAGATLREETIEQLAPSPRPRPRLRRASPPPAPPTASDDVSNNPDTSPPARPAPQPVVPNPPVTPASNRTPFPAVQPVSPIRPTSSAEAFAAAPETPTPPLPRPSAATPLPPPTNPSARPVPPGRDKGIEPSTPPLAPRAHLPIDRRVRPAAPEIGSVRPVSSPVTPAAPSIQISIGHIEVQAVLPKPGSPAATPPKPQRLVLSLEDYLARRNAPRP